MILTGILLLVLTVVMILAGIGLGFYAIGKSGVSVSQGRMKGLLGGGVAGVTAFILFIGANVPAILGIILLIAGVLRAFGVIA